jgi:hypothetical protein
MDGPYLMLNSPLGLRPNAAAAPIGLWYYQYQCLHRPPRLCQLKIVLAHSNPPHIRHNIKILYILLQHTIIGNIISIGITFEYEI